MSVTQFGRKLLRIAARREPLGRKLLCIAARREPLGKLLKSLAQDSKKDLVIRIETNSFKRGLDKSKELMKKMERTMRIQKLELAIKRMNITRSWV